MSRSAPVQGSALAFEQALAYFRRRYLLQQYLRRLAVSALPWFSAGCLLLLILQWRGLFSGGLGAGLALLLGWLVGVGAWTLLLSPGKLQAFGLWDRFSEQKDAFLSAWCFLRKESPAAAELHHVQLQHAKLEKAVRGLPALLPLSFSWKHIAPAAIAVGLLASPVAEAPAPEPEPTLSEAEHERALAELAELRKESSDLELLHPLQREHKERLDKLKAQLEETYKKLELTRQSTRRDVLTELENRAREAEALARDMSANSDKLSEKLLAEMDRHADFNALAEALRSMQLEMIALEAEKLAEAIGSGNLSMQQAQRMSQALQQMMRQASQGDKNSRTMKALSQLQKALQQGQRKQGAQQLRKWANALRQQRKQQLSGNRLRQMAKSLRRAGRKIVSPGQRSMQRLANQQQRPSPQGMQRVQNMGTPPRPLGYQSPNRPRSPSSGRSPGPGGLSQNQRQGMSRSSAAPVPGQGRQSLSRKGGAPVPGQRGGQQGGKQGSGQGQGKGGQAPVPGAKPGQGQGQGQGKGSGQNSQQSSNSAGTGSAPFQNNPTKARLASRTSVVQAQLGDEGDAHQRAVDSASRREGSGIDPQEVALQQIEAEEAALADEPLPPGQRELVIRYFQTVRTLFEP